MYRDFFAACLLAVPCLCWGDWTGDIAGIKLGMTADEAKAAVLRTSPRMLIDDRRMADGTPWGFVGLDASEAAPMDQTSNNGQKIKVDYVVVSFEEGKVWYVGRRQVFPEGAQPLGNKVLDALLQKYGRPNEFWDKTAPNDIQNALKLYLSNSSGYALVRGGWIHDRKGNQQVNACRGEGGGYSSEPVPKHSFLDQPMGTGPTAEQDWYKRSVVDRLARDINHFTMPTNFFSNCGKVAHFSIGESVDNSTFTKSVTVVAFDSAKKYDKLLAMQKGEQAKKNQEKKNVEGMKINL